LEELDKKKLIIFSNQNLEFEFAYVVLSWKSPNWKLVEFIELENYPYFIVTQAHSEFQSSLQKAHPLFVGLVKASLGE